jgi:hypothetical protein
MLDLMMINNSRKNIDWDNMSNNEKTMYIATNFLIVVLYITLFLWALMRAMKVRDDQKPIHLLFALVSPGFYLIFSYFLDGFYQSN